MRRNTRSLISIGVLLVNFVTASDGNNYIPKTKAIVGSENIQQMKMTASELESILHKLDDINSDPLSNEYEKEVRYNNLVRSLSPEERRLAGIDFRQHQSLSTTPPTMPTTTTTVATPPPQIVHHYHHLKDFKHEITMATLFQPIGETSAKQADDNYYNLKLEGLERYGLPPQLGQLFLHIPKNILDNWKIDLQHNELHLYVQDKKEDKSKTDAEEIMEALNIIIQGQLRQPNSVNYTAPEDSLATAAAPSTTVNPDPLTVTKGPTGSSPNTAMPTGYVSTSTTGSLVSSIGSETTTLPTTTVSSSSQATILDEVYMSTTSPLPSTSYVAATTTLPAIVGSSVKPIYPTDQGAVTTQSSAVSTSPATESKIDSTVLTASPTSLVTPHYSQPQETPAATVQPGPIDPANTTGKQISDNIETNANLTTSLDQNSHLAASKVIEKYAKQLATETKLNTTYPIVITAVQAAPLTVGTTSNTTHPNQANPANEGTTETTITTPMLAPSIPESTYLDSTITAPVPPFTATTIAPTITAVSENPITVGQKYVTPTELSTMSPSDGNSNASLTAGNQGQQSSQSPYLETTPPPVTTIKSTEEPASEYQVPNKPLFVNTNSPMTQTEPSLTSETGLAPPLGLNDKATMAYPINAEAVKVEPASGSPEVATPSLMTAVPEKLKSTPDLQTVPTIPGNPTDPTIPANSTDPTNPSPANPNPNPTNPKNPSPANPNPNPTNPNKYPNPKNPSPANPNPTNPNPNPTTYPTTPSSTSNSTNPTNPNPKNPTTDPTTDPTNPTNPTIPSSTTFWTIYKGNQTGNALAVSVQNTSS